ncbi:MAG: dTDP-4-dehydrorhamnose reductase [Bacteroidetes bacterium SW_9_63_38]|nr:MAG: dTDP-4-dehydrorhamnose reductase [Bacteroidetes bacterium SW_9_63_38]
MPELPDDFPLSRSPLPPCVLVTGANGLLGQALLHRLAATDSKVLATARDDALRPSVDCDYQPMDVTDPDAVSTVFEDADPDVVVNCAALSDIGTCNEHRNEAWATNARAVKRLAKRCKEHRAHLIQISTDFVFNGKRGPYDEEARPDPVNYYGRTKLAAENAIREVGISDWTVVRTVLLYGTGTDLSRTNIVQWMMEELAAGETIHVVTDQHRTPTYAPDLADGIARVIERDATGIYHISGREMVTIHELAETVANVFGFDSSLVDPVPSSYFDDAVERPPKTGFLILKAESELGYDPHSLKTGLRAVGRTLGLDPAS